MDVASSQLAALNFSDTRNEQVQQSVNNGSQVVGQDNSSGLTSDFTAILESYRAKSDLMEGAAKKAAHSGGANGDIIAQLSNLYSYSVDTQLLIRASSQVTSGVRQLMSGQ